MTGTSSVATASRHKIMALPELRVVGGLHTGVCVSLEGESYSLGSTPKEDIVLRDAGIKPHHAILRIVGHDVRVEAMGGDLIVGGELVSVGHGCRLRMPVDIRIGEASLHLSRRGASGSIGKRLQPALAQIVKRPMIAASGVLFCALVVTVASKGVQVSTDEKISRLNMGGSQTVAVVSEQHALNDPGRLLLPGHSELDQTPMQQIKNRLMQKLDEVGITTLTAVTADGQILMRGRIAPELELAWLATQRWFDETYTGQAVLTSQVAIGGGSMPDLRLGAIWYGERPYIVLDDGLQYYEGANLGSGWVVQKITEDRLILKHPFKNETFALTY